MLLVSPRAPVDISSAGRRIVLVHWNEPRFIFTIEELEQITYAIPCVAHEPSLFVLCVLTFHCIKRQEIYDISRNKITVWSSLEPDNGLLRVVAHPLLAHHQRSADFQLFNRSVRNVHLPSSLLFFVNGARRHNQPGPTFLESECVQHEFERIGKDELFQRLAIPEVHKVGHTVCADDADGGAYGQCNITGGYRRFLLGLVM